MYVPAVTNGAHIKSFIFKNNVKLSDKNILFTSSKCIKEYSTSKYEENFNIILVSHRDVKIRKTGLNEM